ncbi:MAG: hypothetical protein R3A52_03215 [Polyangiales bacterium]
MSSSFKRALNLAVRGAVGPLVLAYKAETSILRGERAVQVFQGYSQALALLPGLSGQFVRRAFYAAVVTECHEDSCIQWGTIFSNPDVTIARGVYIGARCTVGRAVLAPHVTIGSNVDILSGKNQHGFDDPDVPVQEQPGRYDRVHIGENTWLGNGAVIMADVGARCVVAAGAVVVDRVPDDSIVGGNPARVLKRRDPHTRQWVKPS